LSFEKPDDIKPVVIGVLKLLAKEEPTWKQASNEDLTTKKRRFRTLYKTV